MTPLFVVNPLRISLATPRRRFATACPWPPNLFLSQTKVDREGLSPEDTFKWRQTHIYFAAAKANTWNQVTPDIRKVKPPRLLENSYKAMFLIHRGFDMSRFSQYQLTKLLSIAARLPASMEPRQDVTVNPVTNTINLSREL